MASGPLDGIGVLVTRPAHQANRLIEAIAAAGGHAIRFPAIEIVPRSSTRVRHDATGLDRPDLAIFVSANAVEYGLEYASNAKIAAVGPATAAAIEAAGHMVDIRPRQGFDSEHLLAEPELQSVDGAVVRIIRGNAGRELVANTLRQRGAMVEYLAVYERRVPAVSAEDAAVIDNAWRAGEVHAVTAMSVETLRNLVSILPSYSRDRLAETLVVTPAERVIIEAQNLFPGIPAALAKSTGADDIVQAIAEHARGHST